MRPMNLSHHDPAVRGLVERARAAGRPNALPFGAPDTDARPALAALGDLWGGRSARASQAARAAQAALWLLHDFMDECHGIAQDLDTPEGSYLHAIVHRREPDAGNARYWFSALGAHPIFPELLADAREIAGPAPAPALRPLVEASTWRPERFVALATGPEAATTGKVLLAIQAREWDLLFDHVSGAARAD